MAGPEEAVRPVCSKQAIDRRETVELTALDALAQMRLRLPGNFLASVAASEQVGSEHFGGGAEAETLAGRGIQARAELTEVLLGERVRIGVAA